MRFGVLGPVAAWDGAGTAVALKGPRHRAVLARLVIARRRVVPVARLVEDLWPDPPDGAVGAVRTFVAALRRAVEPDRPPRTPAGLLVTEGPGYALRADPDAVDAWRFERAVADAATLPPGEGLLRLTEALGWWRGPAYAEFADEPWARAERSRLTELRLHAVERRAEVRLVLGLAAEAVPDLDAHVTEHPWREDAWRLLALALYRTGRQGDALAVLRRARTLLVEQLGVDPGPGLRGLEADILHQTAADRLAERHELPLVGVFTDGYRALRLAATGQASEAEAEAAYRAAAARLDAAGMPGLQRGLLPLTLLCLRLQQGRPAPADEGTDWGPYEPWARPLVLLARDRGGEAAAALRRLPSPPRDLLFEALWCLAARAAIAVGDRKTIGRAYAELAPAAAELAGAGSGLLTLGPVSRYLADLAHHGAPSRPDAAYEG